MRFSTINRTKAALVLPITVNALPTYKQWGGKTDSDGGIISGYKQKLLSQNDKHLRLYAKLV